MKTPARRARYSFSDICSVTMETKEILFMCVMFDITVLDVLQTVTDVVQAGSRDTFW